MSTFPFISPMNLNEYKNLIFPDYYFIIIAFFLLLQSSSNFRCPMYSDCYNCF